MKRALPFLKWVGGKRQLLGFIHSLISDVEINNYYEPFLGAGAVFFSLDSFKIAYLNDKNTELINLYLDIRDNLSSLTKLLDGHKANDCEDYFYDIRSLDRGHVYVTLPSVVKSARLLYLNKTCYGGIYRVNKMGQFNVPYARYMCEVNFKFDNLERVSNLLKEKEVHLLNSDYESVLENATKNDLVFLDPPYFPLDCKQSFDLYHKDSFGFGIQEKENEQVRISKVVEKLISKGCYVILCNSNTKFIKDLYSTFDGLYMHEVPVNRFVNSNPLLRHKNENKELIITNLKK